MMIEQGTKLFCYQFLDERYPDRWTLIEVTRVTQHFCFFAESRSVPVKRLPIEHLEKGRYSIKDFTFWIATPEDLEKFHNAKKKAALIEKLESANFRKLPIESLQQILSIVEAEPTNEIQDTVPVPRTLLISMLPSAAWTLFCSTNATLPDWVDPPMGSKIPFLFNLLEKGDQRAIDYFNEISNRDYPNEHAKESCETWRGLMTAIAPALERLKL